MSFAKIRPRRGTADQWTNANPVLVEGELGIEVPNEGVGTGVCRMKFGDGVTAWTDLPYGDNNDKSTIIDTIYPIGSIYMSVNEVNPTNFLGGTWEQIKDKFLLSAGDSYSAGSTGGEATHTLTIDEIPSHTHTFTGTAVNTGNQSANHTHSIPALSGSTNETGAHTHDMSNEYRVNMTVGSGSNTYGINCYSAGQKLATSSNGNHKHTVTTTASTTGANSANHTHSVTAKGTNANTGGGSAHNNMPPYLAVYMWKRID